MNIATWYKTQNYAVEDKYSMLWEWSEYNMIFTSLKWDISKKGFHFLQSACSDQIPLPAQNCKVSVKGLSKIRIKIITKIKVTCSSALIPAFSRIYYLERLGWCLALPSSCFSRARSTSRKREMIFRTFPEDDSTGIFLTILTNGSREEVRIKPQRSF